MITLYTILLSNNNPNSVAIDNAIAIKPIPVRDKVIELFVVAIITNVTNDFNIAVNVLFFLYFF